MPTVWRGLSEVSEFWNTTWARWRKRASGLAPTTADAKRSVPPRAGSSRSSRRPSVDLPQPDSPTRPSTSPVRIVERHAIHRLHAARFAEQALQPAAAVEADAEPRGFDQRHSGRERRDSGRRGLGGPWQIGDRLDAVAAHSCGARRSRRLRLIAAGARKGAARTEVAAGIGRAEVGQVALDGREPAGMGTVGSRQRGQQALGVGMARAMQHRAGRAGLRPRARHRAPTPYRRADRRCRDCG